ncbi:MAG: glycerophosphodiester phosphodiesterase family protein, partial [Solirubrobacterales bacterium]
MHPFLDHVGPIPFAHRGGASSAPENTLVAFQDAIELGYRHVETDVHATSDGVLLAFHDDDLTRSCGDPRRIA